MEFHEAMNILEAVLFASGEPVSTKKLCEVLGVDNELLENIAQELGDKYDYDMRGIKLIRLNDSYQMCSRADYAPYVRSVMEARRPNPLSQSSLEVLAIAAYKQPVTRAYIEQVRGVDSSYTVNALVEKGLIKSAGRLDVPGRPQVYKTTEGFLRAFGISDISQLPDMPNFSEEQAEQIDFLTIAERDTK